MISEQQLQTINWICLILNINYPFEQRVTFYNAQEWIEEHAVNARKKAKRLSNGMKNTVQH